MVIAASHSTEAVLLTLESLRAQSKCDRIEVLIVAPRDTIPRPPSLHDGVHWIEAEPGSSVPRLRRLGLDRARAEIVVFTEDSCRFDDEWATAWLDVFVDEQVGAATGPVEPAMGDRAIDQAVFFCEYAPFLPSRISRTGPPDRLAGNNFAVRRSLSARLDPVRIEECDVPEVVALTDGSLATADRALAFHVRRFSAGEAFGERFRFGHAYGRHRGERASRTERLAGLAAGPAILVSQTVRLVLTMVRKRRIDRGFTRAFPLTVALLSAWSAGEWLGWATAAVPPRLSHRRRGRAGRPHDPRIDRHRSQPPRCSSGPQTP